MQVTDKGRKESNERKEREGVCTRVRVEGCVLPQLSVFGVLAGVGWRLVTKLELCGREFGRFASVCVGPNGCTVHLSTAIESRIQHGSQIHILKMSKSSSLTCFACVQLLLRHFSAKTTPQIDSEALSLLCVIV